ncbi:hypothetical protein GCM10009734_49100 [Nonomuraea bangladeshensis]
MTYDATSGGVGGDSRACSAGEAEATVAPRPRRHVRRATKPISRDSQTGHTELVAGWLAGYLRQVGTAYPRCAPSLGVHRHPWV